MSIPTLYSTEVAIPLPSLQEVKAILGDGFDPATSLNVVQMLAGTEDMYPAAVGMVRAIFSADGIDPKLRQMIILRAATVLNVPYEWQANVPMSLNNGLTQAHVDAAATDGPVTGVELDYVLVCRATDELLKSATLSDATLGALLERHGDVNTRKIVLVISWFSLLSLFLNGCRVRMETTDKIGGKKTPLG